MHFPYTIISGRIFYYFITMTTKFVFHNVVSKTEFYFFKCLINQKNLSVFNHTEINKKSELFIMAYTENLRFVC